MAMIDFDKLTQELVSKHQPDLILLYGSFARGEYTPKSDIDVVCFKDIQNVETDNRDFSGLYLDCWIKPLSELEKIEESIYLDGAKVLYDKNDIAPAFLEKVRERLEFPPKPLSEQERQHLKAWTLKMLDRTYRGDIEANFRRAWLVFELLQTYYKWNGLWYRGSKLAFRELKEKKPKIYKQFDKVLKNPTDSILIKQLVYKIFGL